MKLNVSKTNNIIVGRSRIMHPHYPVTPHQRLPERWWRSLMTLIYGKWHLIPGWPLRSIFAWLPEQRLKDLVSWVSPTMIYRFLVDAFVVLSRPFCSIVLQCRALLPIHSLNYRIVHWKKFFGLIESIIVFFGCLQNISFALVNYTPRIHLHSAAESTGFSTRLT